jgi:2-oxoglutarate dehydrogenase E1 component
MQVANCTTPANYFHILRRQMHREFRKPLVIMTPKSLLRHKLAVSSAADFTGDSHFMRLISDSGGPADADVRRLVLCSGKIAYELMEARDKAGDTATSIVRVEQLYPFPSEPIVERLGRMPALEEVVWAQEEPRNNGYWTFVEPFLEQCLVEAEVRPKRPRYAGRGASASPATGLAKRHAAEQAALIADALGHSSEAAPRRKAG